MWPRFIRPPFLRRCWQTALVTMTAFEEASTSEYLRTNIFCFLWRKSPVVRRRMRCHFGRNTPGNPFYMNTATTNSLTTVLSWKNIYSIYIYVYSHSTCPCSLELCFLHHRQPTSPTAKTHLLLPLAPAEAFREEQPEMLHELDVKEQETIIGGSRAPLLSDAC